jgi:cellulose synthase/poly-beta-1,6-N-acetylglucosamine synthase-like glycosyltransferase
MEKGITVIVPAYNEQELIAGCLDSLLNQAIDKDRYEIIVIDNNSTDLTAQVTAGKGVRVEREPQKGYVHAIRRGIEVARTDLIAFTDADCRVPVDWIARILDRFSSSPDVIAVGGKLSFYDLHPSLNKFIRMLLYSINVLPGNNMAVKREAINQIGGIDPRVNLSLDYWLTVKLRRSRFGKISVDKDLVVITSGRRFRGSFTSDLRYFINVISILITAKPIYYDFPDVREVPGQVQSC